MNKISIFVFLLSIICSVPQAAEQGASETAETTPSASTAGFEPNPRLTLIPSPVAGSIEIDGILDSIWSASAYFGNFTEYQPAENRMPEVMTRGYVAHDDEHLYVAFICKDPDISKLRASLTDRDHIYDDDWVCVSIDPNRNHQMAYEFFVNARGIQGDRLWESNGNEDDGFDLVWFSDAKIFNDYWTAEIKIPFSSLRFPNQEVQDWSVHFFRQYPRENNYRYSWMPISEDNNSLMSQAGNLEFQLKQRQADKKNLEILPYIIGTQQNIRNQTGPDPEVGSWDRGKPESRMGFGIKYGLSSSFIVDFSYNPDFSQIESDAGQISVNNPFALFYTERRPFFQEGSEIYTVDRPTNGAALDQYVDLFYSRSINSPLVAGKISGKTGNISMGITTAIDQNTPFVIPFEENTAVLATDRKSYNTIVRGKYDLGNQSAIGVFLSDRRFDESGSNSVAAVDGSIRLSEKYTVSGIAAVTRTTELEDPELSGALGNGTFKIRNEEITNMLDGESFWGTLMRAKVERESRTWISAFAYQDFSPGFRADNGFITTNSYRNIDFVNTYFFRFEEHPVLTYIRPQISVWRKFNYDGIVKDTGIRSQLAFNFRNQTFVQFSAFIFNRENLYGKQFDDARSAWVYIQNRTLKNVFAAGFVHVGNQINRFGVEGDPRNPFEIVPSLRYQFDLTLKPAAQISNDVSYTDFTLWKAYGRDKIVGQQIIRDAITYQFSKTMSIRLIAEYNIVDYYSNGLAKRISQKYFTFDPLFSYKLNAFSVFYLGGRLGANNNLYLDWNSMKLTDQSAFLKFQYLFKS